MDHPATAVEASQPAHPGRRRWIAALLIGALALVALGVFVATRPSAAPDRPARLVLVGPDGSLATADAGGPIRRIVSPAGDLQFPAWSPDGRRIAAIGVGGSDVGVIVFDPAANGGAGASMSIYASGEQPPFYLYWTPDSRQVTFLTSERGTIALRVAPADGGTPAEVVHQGQPFYWDFVDPGRLMIHTGLTGPEAFIGELDLEGTLADGIADAGLFRAPAVAAGGTHRAFVRAVDGDPARGQELVVEASDGTARHASPVEGYVAFGFDPEGTALAFIGPTGPAAPTTVPIGPLRVVDVTSGAIRTVVDARVVGFFWSPDGRTMATLEIPAGSVVDPNEALGPGRQVASLAGSPPGLAAAEQPGVGIHLRFVDVASGRVHSERDIRISELFAFQVLPYFDQYARSHRIWSADSRSIVLPIARETDEVGIVSLPADGSDPQPIADGRLAFWSP